ncbi:PPE domain-containing protein [Mycolicibacterium frederiksbergense]|uniref:PPE domain-containing protein n=1 Tax=Mycolicibacterium frederiksbergense TaxID=117567 RepID=UPI00399BC855
MTSPLKVEPADLRGKAASLDVPLPPTPEQPQAPCGLELAGIAVRQISAEGEGMKSFIAAGQEEAALLSGALKAAASTYESTDRAGAAAIDGTVGEIAEIPVPKMDAPVSAPQMPVAACPAPPGYLAVEVAAEQIAQPDQAATLDSFAANWGDYAAQLASRAEEFDLDTVDWDGSAAEVAGTALRRHKTWLQEMARAAVKMADHAKELARIHRWAAASHPTVAEVQAITAQLGTTTDATQMSLLLVEYQKLQVKSEEVLADYAAAAAVTPVTPPTPPIRQALQTGWDSGKNKTTTRPTAPPPTGTGNPAGGGGSEGGAPAQAAPQQPPSTPMSTQSGQPAGSPPSAGAPSSGGAPSGGGSPSGAGKPGGGGGLPSGGLPGGGGTPGSDLPEPGLDDPGISPAGVGGGGSGGGSGAGGGGAPALPLQPNVGAETVAPSPGGGARGGGSGAIPASAMGGGMGAMGGGMGGMGHGGGQQGKEKRRDPRFAPDEELYVEERAYTEPVIGNRRRKDVPDKEPK